MTTVDVPVRWALKHAWSGPSDRAALALCAQELAKIGVAFVDAADIADADAVKLHGFELVEARAAGELAFTDLHAVARREDWPRRVDPRAWRFMASGPAVHGVPMGIHQANAVWANGALAADIARDTAPGAADLAGWLRSASRRVAKPLAIGREAWQIGILFEALCLAEAGAPRYERAFVDLDPDALGGPEVKRALATMLELREFVDDDRLDTPWRALLRDVGEGRAAAMIMGDWAGASGLPLFRLMVRGVADACIAIVDLFVPLGDAAVSPQVAAAFTTGDFQARFARIKGCSPAVVDADAAGLQAATVTVPSLTFDQCCAMRTKRALLEIVADHFLLQRDPARTAAGLSEVGRSCGAGG
jgi:hypothetical protein